MSTTKNTEKEKELLPCPHCGNPPSLFVARSEDEGIDNGIDIDWIRALRRGATYYCIECCTVMDGVDWERMRDIWNTRA